MAFGHRGSNPLPGVLERQKGGQMNPKKHLWRKITEIGLILFLMTMGVAMHPSASYLESIVNLIPYIQSIFIISIFISLIGILGLSSSCRTTREFKLNLGRAIYLPSLIGIITVLLTQGLIKRVILQPQFIISALAFILGFILSWTS